MDEYYVPEFIKQVNDIQPEVKTNMEKLADNFSMSQFYWGINNLHRMEEKDRYNFVKSNLDFISRQIVEGTCNYYRRLTEPVFLNIYKDVLSSMPVSMMRRLAANLLAYSYRYSKNVDTGTMQSFRGIATIANKQDVELLKALHLPADIAIDLCVARFSSLDEILCVHRLNHEICLNGEIMTEQMIIWIYEQLFTQMRYLFTGTMLETKENTSKNYLGKCTEEEYDETFARVSLAVLTMVNNMPMESIDALIRIFYKQWESVGTPRTRFSLRALSGDFGRVRHIVEALESSEHMYIP